MGMLGNRRGILCLAGHQGWGRLVVLHFVVTVETALVYFSHRFKPVKVLLVVGNLAQAFRVVEVAVLRRSG